MPKVFLRLLALVLCMVASVPAKAQERRVPHSGSQAVGFDFGVFLPSSDSGDQLDVAAPVSGFYEYYVTPRVSLRGSTGWTQPSVSGSSIDQVRMMPLQFGVNYNWEGGKVHPFVGAGVGAYFLQYRRRGATLGESVTKPGMSAGGGIEYFLSRTVALKGEGRYHAVADIARVDPSGTTLTFGVKTYF
jgi:opacity protein-like surface antigen